MKVLVATRLIWPLLAYATPDRKSIRRRETSLPVDSRFNTTVRLALSWSAMVEASSKRSGLTSTTCNWVVALMFTTLLLCCLTSGCS